MATHVIYLAKPLLILFRERIEGFPNSEAPEVFDQVYSPAIWTTLGERMSVVCAFSIKSFYFMLVSK